MQIDPTILNCSAEYAILFLTVKNQNHKRGQYESQKPPFEITSQILSDVADIAELIGRISGAGRLSASPELRRVSRINCIY